MNFLSKRHVLESLERAKETKTVHWRDNLPTWCPGCGHFTALHALYESIETLEIPPKNVVVVSGIGCSGRFPFFIKGFGFHALHGRAIPVAVGIKIANPELHVVVVGGDGDGLGIGGGHLPHAARNNIDITYILLDNSIYGLTKGQVSPTSPLGVVSGTTPYGNIARPLNPSTLAVSYGATYVARIFSKMRDFSTHIIKRAMEHKGFSIIHLLTPCVVFNQYLTYKTIDDMVQELPENYSPGDRLKAMEYTESSNPVYLGTFLEENIPTYQDQQSKTIKSLETQT